MNWTKQSLKNKRATIDMKCTDTESFKWSVTRSLNPLVKNSERVTKVLRIQSEEYNWGGISFPTTMEQVKVFEKNNNLLVNVFTLDEERGSIRVLRMVEGGHAGRASLMLFNDRYLVVKSLSRLFCGQDVKNRSKRFFCNNCLEGFLNEFQLSQHLALGCGPKAKCDFCSRHKRSDCPLHLDLSEVGGERLGYVKEMREEILSPIRIRDIFLMHEGDTYKAILKEGGWVCMYMGKTRQTKIVSVDEGGNAVRMEHACSGCDVDGVDCGCLTKDENCDLCRRLGRGECPFHTLSTHPEALEIVESNRKDVEECIGTKYSVRRAVGGEMYFAVLKQGRWVFSYCGNKKAKRECYFCRIGCCLDHVSGLVSDSDSENEF